MVSKLSPKTFEYIEEIIERGHFESADQAVTEALRLLENQIKAERLEAKLQSALDQSVRGELTVDSPEWRDQHFNDLLERFHSGERADPNYFD